MKLQPVILDIDPIAISSGWHDSSAGPDGGAGSDADGDSDTDADNDADSDADADTDTDADTETDTGTGTGTGAQPCEGDECPDLVWVSIPGGTFQMGSDEVGAQPVHEVDVPSFEITKTEVTVAQYAECVAASACVEPSASTEELLCNWEDQGYEEHPVNCVSWHQAVSFCQWVGGRLPSEAEWEYAASGAGQDITYPWGDEQASCEYAIMKEYANGCDTGRTWSVCSKPDGNTDQGLCDMAGNVYEWVQDWFHPDYTGAPTDGSAWEDQIDYSHCRMVRGGSYHSTYKNLHVTERGVDEKTSQYGEIGFRCARSF
ncbi:MAG: formylglycine-generating enzyme family protein [Polyangia bacterium]